MDSPLEPTAASAGSSASAHRTACSECDLILEVIALREGECARCPRCGHVLSSRAPDALTRSLALGITSLVLLLIANSFPFLSLHASGLGKVMTLPGSALELYRDGYLTIAVLVLGPIVGVPALMLGTLVALLVPLRRRRPARWLAKAGRLLFALSPWAMVEVFVIGVIVSLVKISELATVEVGVSFWSYVAFALCFTATLSSLDRFQLWREIEACAP